MKFENYFNKYWVEIIFTILLLFVLNIFSVINIGTFSEKPFKTDKVMIIEKMTGKKSIMDKISEDSLKNVKMFDTKQEEEKKKQIEKKLMADFEKETKKSPVKNYCDLEDNKKCLNRHPKICDLLPCCVRIDNKCVEGDREGPTYLDDLNGKDEYYFLGEKIKKT